MYHQIKSSITQLNLIYIICTNIGVDKPGQIIYFDHKGEVMGTTSFNPGMVYGAVENDGGCGVHEIGNRGTQQGMNM